VKKAYQNCVAFSHNQADKIEPDWMAHAQERLNQEDEKESAATAENGAQGRQGKKR
jgi:hypothetical protein